MRRLSDEELRKRGKDPAKVPFPKLNVCALLAQKRPEEHWSFVVQYPGISNKTPIQFEPIRKEENMNDEIKIGNAKKINEKEIWECEKCGCLIAINEGVEDENGGRLCDACSCQRM